MAISRSSRFLSSLLRRIKTATSDAATTELQKHMLLKWQFFCENFVDSQENADYADRMLDSILIGEYTTFAMFAARCPQVLANVDSEIRVASSNFQRVAEPSTAALDRKINPCTGWKSTPLTPDPQLVDAAMAVSSSPLDIISGTIN